jgi:GDPmannose 4,6-dehydratase
MLLGNASKAKKILGWKPKVGFKELARIMADADMRLAQREKVIADHEKSSG